MIGADFEKIQFTLFGLDLLEPMALITDSILGVFAVYLGWRISKFSIDKPFYRNWRMFFIVFGVGAFVGGLGHGFYNYWGELGKIPSWFAGPLSIFFIERAMISIHPNEKTKQLLTNISNIKLVVVYGIWLYLLISTYGSGNPRAVFMPIAINTIVGVILSAAVLGNYYKKVFNKYYSYFVWGVIILFPSSILFILKINLHPWFDKNDFSHVLFAFGIYYFYLGAKKVAIFNNLIKQ